MTTVFTRLLTDVRGVYDIWQHRREGALAGITSFAGNFPFTCVPLREFSIEIVTTVHYILVFSGIVHGGYKSVHRTGASRCVKWPSFLITHGMECAWNLEMCRPFRQGCSGRMKNWFLPTRTDIRISLWSSTLFTSNTWLVRNVFMYFT